MLLLWQRQLAKIVDKRWITVDNYGRLLPMSFTYQPKKRKRAKTHGFLVRSRTKTGKRVIRARRRRGRAKLSV